MDLSMNMIKTQLISLLIKILAYMKIPSQDDPLGQISSELKKNPNIAQPFGSIKL